MDENREFKDSPLGMIPKDWTSCDLKDVINKIVGGGTPSRSKSDYWFGDIPWASVKDFKDDVQVLYQTEEYITKNGLINSASNIIEAGIPLICTRMAVGRAVIAVVPVAINQDLKALYPSDKINSTYLLVLLNFYRQKLASLAIGSTVKGIRIDELLSLHINVPPIPQQQQITRILDTVDKAIAQTETLIAKYKRVKTGLMQDLLTRGIDEHGQLRDPKTHKFKRSPLGMIPDEWDVVTIKNIATDVTDGDHHTPLRSESGIFLLSARNIFNGYLNLEDVDFIPDSEYQRMIKRCHPEYGDIFISCSGSIGRVCEVPKNLLCALVRSVALIKLDRNRCFSRFVALILQSPILQRQILAEQQQAAQPNLFQGSINRLQLAIPRLLQEQVVISNIINKYESLIHQEQLYSNKLQLQKIGLMQDLLTGKTSVKPLLTNQP